MASSFDMTMNQQLQGISEAYNDGVEQERLDEIGGVEGICQRLNVDPSKGINSKTREKRQAAYGRNEVPPEEFPSFCELFGDQLQDFTMIMLIVAAAVSIGLGIYGDVNAANLDQELPNEWIEGVAILVTVLLVAFLGAGVDHQKNNVYKSMQDKACLLYTSDAADE